MHLGLKTLARFLATHGNDEHLVLASVVETAGSTYRKPGAMMLIAADGSHAGLISGGCLEADLVGHTQPVFDDGEPRRLSYDLHDDEELVLSLGLGCGGDVHLLLQRLDGTDGFGAFGHVLAGMAGRHSAWLATVTDGPGMGAQALRNDMGDCLGHPDLQSVLPAVTADSSKGGRTRVVEAVIEGIHAPVLLTHIAAPPHVLVCGAGPDAVPLAAQVALLGWDCTVTDHRLAYAVADRFPGDVVVNHARPGQLTDTVDLSGVDAAVVMSHHVRHDETYLRQLATCQPAYLGLLGPARRRMEVCGRAGVPPEHVRGPVGLDIGAELPESIALAIMAEIHAALNGCSALPLDHDV